MTTLTARRVAEAYRWHRRLGNRVLAAGPCCIVSNRAWPEVWDANHADAVTAESDAEIAAVFAAMDACLGHTPWRVIHSDGFTPDPFLARLALDGYLERPATIQMVLPGALAEKGAAIALRPVVGDADWAVLDRLVAADLLERGRSPGLDLSPAFAASMAAVYRSKSPSCRFELALLHGEAVAYGARALAPNGVGMIEDLFTLPSARRQGVATAIIAAFADALRAGGCHTVFLGALASEAPKRLYARLGFRPVGLARTWVAETPSPAQDLMGAAV